ncbi:MAG: sodium:proton antiporter, partial [Chromatiaceae bacterium]
MSRWRLSHVLASLLTGVLSVVLVLILLDLPDHSGLSEPVAQAMDRSGVGHDVTAVLLNFRGYDTFLELAVLVLAVWVVWSLGRHDPVPVRSVRGPVMRGTLRHLLPVAVLTGGYLVWAGASATGGAFQGGAVLGAAGVILVLSRPR